MRERQMKECVYAEACEGMLEDMPVTVMKLIRVLVKDAPTHSKPL